MKESIRTRLKKYGILAGTTLAGATASNADIVYVDVDPDDSVYVHNTKYYFDFDSNNIVDLKLRQIVGIGYSAINVTAPGGGGILYSYFVTGGAPNWYWMDNLSYGEYVSSLDNFADDGWLGVYVPGVKNWGKFDDVQDAYLGFRFWAPPSNDYYGWIRLDVDTLYRSFIVKDYAYNDVADSSIMVGQLPVYADTAQNVALTNLSLVGDATDLSISFDLAGDQSGVEEYRVYFFKNTDSANVDLNTLRKSNFYVSYGTASSVSNVSMASGLRDVFGNFISGSTTYRYVVLSVPNGSTATNHSMSAFSNPVTLTTFTADVVTNLTASVISNNCNGTSFLFEFDKAPDETGIQQYVVMAVKEEDASSFTVSDAEAVQFPNYFTLPTGSNISQHFSAYATDVDGDTIQTNTPYVFFVLSKGNGTSHVSELAGPSNSISLTGCTSVPELLATKASVQLQNGQLLVETELRNYTLQVIDLNGRTLQSTGILHGNTSVPLQNGMNRGIYMVLLQNDDTATIVKKVFVD